MHVLALAANALSSITTLFDVFSHRVALLTHQRGSPFPLLLGVDLTRYCAQLLLHVFESVPLVDFMIGPNLLVKVGLVPKLVASNAAVQCDFATNLQPNAHVHQMCRLLVMERFLAFEDNAINQLV